MANPVGSGCDEEESLVFVLFAHHERQNLGRTIRLRLGERVIHLCARCTGKYAGEATGFLPFLLWGIDPPPLPAVLVLLLFPLPAMFDWVTQRLGRRESRNSVRLLTGYLLGIALGLWALLLVKGLFFLFLLGVVIAISYGLLVLSLLRR